jgi:mannose-6-phosphate isomerase-like protein (cupin superfamily)
MQPLIHKPDPSAEYETPERCRILKIWDDDRDGAASVARATVKPGVTTQPHRLREVDERYLILQGTGVVRIGDMAPQRVEPGDVVVIPAGTPQRISNTGDTDLVFYCICTPRFSPGCYESLA